MAFYGKARPEPADEETLEALRLMESVRIPEDGGLTKAQGMLLVFTVITLIMALVMGPIFFIGYTQSRQDSLPPTEVSEPVESDGQVPTPSAAPSTAPQDTPAGASY